MKKMNRDGFTLVELVLVLGVVALLTHLAVREATQWRASRLHEVSARGLEEIRVAVVGDDTQRTADGAIAVNGFLADMGRLPQCVAEIDSSGVERLTLGELWCAPRDTESGLARQEELYGVRPATTNNLVVGTANTDADREVVVPGGWRGPYLRLASGKSRLLDGWGNPYETPDSANRRGRLLADYNPTNRWNTPVSQTGEVVVAVRHFGADGRPDRQHSEVEPENRDALLSFFDPWGTHFAPDNYTNAVLHIALTLKGDDGAAGGSGTFTARVYAPYGGKIKVSKGELSVTDGAGNGFVDGLTPGMRVLRIKGGGVRSLPRPILIKPGVNYITEVVYVSD